MNSHLHVSGPNAPAVRVRTPGVILILAAGYVALLIAMGIKMWTWQSGAYWYCPLGAALIPAVIYAIATFVYGRAIFGNSASAPRDRAWLSLLWITALLYAIISTVSVLGLRAEAAEKYPDWRYYLPLVVTTLALVLWAYIGGAAFVHQDSSASRAYPAPYLKLGLLLLAGGVIVVAGGIMMLHQFDFALTDRVFSKVTLRGGSLAKKLIDFDDALRQWFMVAGFVASIAIALFTVATGVIVLSKKFISAKFVTILLSLCVITFWFTLTNYYFMFFWISFFDVFGFGASRRLELAIVIACWLMFVLGIVLWFRYGYRVDNTGRTIKTALIVWYLPLAPLSISFLGLLPLVEKNAYGPQFHVAGLQIITACWWKLWSARANPQVI